MSTRDDCYFLTFESLSKLAAFEPNPNWAELSKYPEFFYLSVFIVALDSVVFMKSLKYLIICIHKVSTDVHIFG
ncbi:hypothetical protein T10_1582 [Trichinella papuae]|uniref:Uncharacterized protein n=1 Tax=Trichinella papuae TaxID=268474 RepID=A0A0V1MIR8_9BILA|nr:hypothetical protein T10_1582 [Trichinella papuae]